jgi:MYXO-CTERM domain-containing protein
MNKLLKIAIVSAALVSSASAGTVAGGNLLNGPGDTLVVNSSGAYATSGTATIGYFNTGFDVSAAVLSGSYQSLVQNFNVLASGSVGNPGGFADPIAGYYLIGDTDYGAPGTRVGALLYSFIGDGATLAASNAFGLLQSTATIDIDGNPPDSNTVNLDIASNASTVLIGKVGTGTANLGVVSGGESVAVNTLTLVAVPETSTALLGLLGLAGLVRRRR